MQSVYSAMVDSTSVCVCMRACVRAWVRVCVYVCLSVCLSVGVWVAGGGELLVLFLFVFTVIVIMYCLNV